MQEKLRIDYSKSMMAVLNDYLRSYETLDSGFIPRPDTIRGNVFAVMESIVILVGFCYLHESFRSDLQDFFRSRVLENGLLRADQRQLPVSETSLEVEITVYCWWPVKQERDRDKWNHCAALRYVSRKEWFDDVCAAVNESPKQEPGVASIRMRYKGSKMYAAFLSKDEIPPEEREDDPKCCRKRTLGLEHRHCWPGLDPLGDSDISQPTLQKFKVLNIQHSAVRDVPFPSGDFLVPAHTRADDIVLFFESAYRGWMFLILRRNPLHSQKFDLVGIAQPYKHTKRGSYMDEYGRPKLTLKLQPDDLLTLSLVRTTNLEHRLIPVTLPSCPSYLEAPGPHPFDTSEATREAAFDPLVDSRADMLVEKLHKKQTRDDIYAKSQAGRDPLYGTSAWYYGGYPGSPWYEG